MPYQRNVRIIAAIVLVAMGFLAHYVSLMSVNKFYGWVGVLNIVPYLVSFGADMVLGMPPDPVYYFGIAVQWTIIGIGIADLYTTRRVPRRPGGNGDG